MSIFIYSLLFLSRRSADFRPHAPSFNGLLGSVVCSTLIRFLPKMCAAAAANGLPRSTLPLLTEP